jgi:hypothetical protein
VTYLDITHVAAFLTQDLLHAAPDGFKRKLSPRKDDEVVHDVLEGRAWFTRHRDDHLTHHRERINPASLLQSVALRLCSL